MTARSPAPETIDRGALEGLVEPFLLRRIDPIQRNFVLRRFVPQPTWNRFDLGFKLIYADALERGLTAFSKRIYASHIAAFSLGDMSEPGNPDKTGIGRFEAEFGALNAEIQARAFDPRKSLLPLAIDGTLLNGGHRAAIAAKHGLEVVGVETGLEPVIFDHEYFRRRGVSADDLDAAAVRIVEALPSAAIALIWPAAHGREAELEALLGPTIYRQKIALRHNGPHNLMVRVYRDEAWLGASEDNYPGAKRKLDECFSGTDELRLVVLNLPDMASRIKLKEAVRDLYRIGKSSIHITDTHAEAVEIARLLSNRNSVHFLNVANPTAFPQTLEKIRMLRAFLDEQGISRDDVALDTGMVLGALGVRPPGDVDVLSRIKLPPGPIESHDSRYRDASASEILADPARHFFYFDFKFVSVAEVARLKRARLAGSDREDLLEMESLILSKDPPHLRQSARFNLNRWWLRRRRAGIQLLFRMGVGAPLQRAYRKLRGNPSSIRTAKSTSRKSDNAGSS